ncbi:MAG: metallophosphatase family protein [Bacteroidales bacterium]|nr:metallophosphatase family protein [Bacteroidales bacterium]
MKKIGILSDTHGYLHPNAYEFFEKCDEIWHAGDIGDPDILTVLQTIAPIRAVWGNCDGWDVRGETSESTIFECEKHKVALMHIVGRPGKYEPKALEIIRNEHPTIFVAGHSHILRVMNDAEHHLMFINPGAAGRYGMHTRLTFLRLDIDEDRLSNLEVYDEPKVTRI